MVSKVSEKLVNNGIVDHLQKCGLFSDFQFGVRSPRSTADLLAVVSNRLSNDFNRSRATQAVALNISKAFERVWHAGLLHKFKSYRISGQIFGHISSLVSNRWLNAGFCQGSIVHPTLFLLYINDLPDDVICNIAICACDNHFAIYAYYTTLCSKCDQASDLCKQLELTSELESD